MRARTDLVSSACCQRPSCSAAIADPAYEVKPFNAIVEQCRGAAEQYDFSSWSDADLLNFFLQLFTLSMEGRA